MSEELGFIVSALERIENKLDNGLTNHENRISRLEGGVGGLKWAVGALLALASLIVGIFFTV